MIRKVVVSQAPHPDAQKMLEERFTVVVPESSDEAVFTEACRDADAIVLRTNVAVTRAVIEQCPNLKIVSRTGAGVDNVDVEAATERGILVCNVVGVNSVSVAEQAVTLMASVLKRVCYMDNAVRTGNWKARRGNTTHELAGKTVGVVGLGNIGRRVASICSKGFGMKILAHDPYAKETIAKEGYTDCDSLEQLFSEADIVTLHCPNIPETHGLASRGLLSKMKPGAILVNSARGEVVDEPALVELLQQGKIAGAGLDVFEQEPPPADHPLYKLDNVVLSPHVGALTEEVSTKVALESAQAVLDFADGKMPKDVYNRDALSKRGNG